MKNIIAILEQINNIVLVLNPKSEVVYVSPSVKKILGFDPGLLMGEGWWHETLVDENELELKTSVGDSIFKTKSTGGVQTERKVLTSYGSVKWFLWNTTLSKDGNILSIGTDITDKKKIEFALEKKSLAIIEKNEEISDSLNYAKRLQEVILPSEDKYSRYFSDAFILYNPKDVVSGDFHWYYETDEVVTLASIDCTGHGVPGALLSVVGNSLLRNIVIKEGVVDPGEVLKRLDKGFLQSMSKDGELVARDGMDLSFVTVYKSSEELHFSGAFRPLIQIRQGELVEFLGSRFPIGFYDDDRKCFKNNVIQIQKGDRYYMFTDGYADQFGGPNNKKLKKTQLKEMLISSFDSKMEEQKDLLNYHFQNWKQNEPQTDDVLVIGFEY